MGKVKDISGQTFGFWRAISPSDQRGADGSILWECECLKCHKIFLINGSNLRSGHSSKGCKSCAATGQSKMKNLSGQRFGKLIAIQPTRKTETGHMVWLCQCDCDNTKEVLASVLIRGATRSCGCLISKGEEKIAAILQQAKVPFQRQKQFLNCKDKGILKFDFFVNQKYLIEYDGSQHYPWGGCWNGDSKEDIIRRDNIKNQYCFINKIPLIRIPYWKFDTLSLSDLQLDTTKYLVQE